MAKNRGRLSTPIYDTTEDQYIDLMSVVTAAASSNNDTPLLADGLSHGNIQITTSAAFNGTTSTIALQGSNDAVTWSTAYQDDNVTPVSFTPAAASTYNVLLKKIMYRYYRLVYTVGDATLGTVSAIFVGKH